MRYNGNSKHKKSYKQLCRGQRCPCMKSMKIKKELEKRISIKSFARKCRSSPPLTVVPYLDKKEHPKKAKPTRKEPQKQPLTPKPSKPRRHIDPPERPFRYKKAARTPSQHRIELNSKALESQNVGYYYYHRPYRNRAARKDARLIRAAEPPKKPKDE